MMKSEIIMHDSLNKRIFSQSAEDSFLNHSSVKLFLLCSPENKWYERVIENTLPIMDHEIRSRFLPDISSCRNKQYENE